MVDHGEYFTKAELECQCGCGVAAMDEDFMDLLDTLREDYGPITLNSAYRCPEHNAKVSSTGRGGPHTTGKAVDVRVAMGDAHRLIKLALLLGFTGIGVKQRGAGRFLHLDTITEGVRPTVWSY